MPMIPHKTPAVSIKTGAIFFMFFYGSSSLFI